MPVLPSHPRLRIVALALLVLGVLAACAAQPPGDVASGDGIGFSKVVELLALPGSGAASDYVQALESTTWTGCTSTRTAAGGTTTTSDVSVVDLGIAGPSVAYTAHLATQTSLGPQTGIPLELEAAVVVVQHGSGLLLLTATAPEPIPAYALDQLVTAAVERAGW